MAARLEDKLVRKYGFSTDIPILDFKTKPFFGTESLIFLQAIFMRMFLFIMRIKMGNKKHKIDISVFFKIGMIENIKINTKAFQTADILN